MARRARLTNDTHDSRNGETSPNSTHQARASIPPLSPSPAASFSSDKENRQAAAGKSHQTKGKSQAIEPPRARSTIQGDQGEPRSSKRRKLSERAAPNASQATHARQLEDVADRDYYDPEQDIEERRALRKDFRDLSKELTGKL